VKSDP